MGILVELKTPNLSSMKDGDIFVKKGNELVPISKTDYLKDIHVEFAKNKTENAKFKEDVKREIEEIKKLLAKIMEAVLEANHEENN